MIFIFSGEIYSSGTVVGRRRHRVGIQTSPFFLKQITFSNFLFPPLCKYQLKNSIKPTQTTRSKEEARIKETKYLSKTVWNGSVCSSFHDSEAGVVVIV